MSASQILVALSLTLAVLSLGGIVVIGLRGKVMVVDLKLARERLDESDKELERKDRRLHDLEVEYEQLKRSDESKSAALSRIGEQAASGAEIAQLAAAIKDSTVVQRDHDREAASRHAAIIKAMRENREVLTEMKEAIAARGRA